jgi:hypothetical protein
MKTHNFDYAYIGLTCARIGSQLKESYVLNLAASFNQEGNVYCTVNILNELPELRFEVVHSFSLSKFDTPQSFLDGVFEYCIEHDLFKQPLDIKLVD